MASPHVAGAAALILQSNPQATPAQVWAAIDAATTKGALSECCGDPDKLLHIDVPSATPTDADGGTVGHGLGDGRVSTGRHLVWNDVCRGLHVRLVGHLDRVGVDRLDVRGLVRCVFGHLAVVLGVDDRSEIGHRDVRRQRRLDHGQPGQAVRLPRRCRTACARIDHPGADCRHGHRPTRRDGCRPERDGGQRPSAGFPHACSRAARLCPRRRT